MADTALPPTLPPSSSAPASSRPARRWWPCISSAAPRPSCSARRRVLLVADKGDEKRLAIHGGGILSAATDGARVVTGGDDGKVFVTDAQGDSRSLRPTPSAAGSIMSRSARTARWRGRPASRRSCRAGKGEPKSIEVQSTVGGLAFAPKGVRLAIAHYNGVSMWFPNAQAAPEFLEWKGSHHHRRSARTASSWSPRCRSRRCTAGASSTPSTCGCPAIRRGCARSAGPPAASGSRRRARSSSCCGRSRARTARWASSRRCSRRFAVRVTAVACHPKQEVVAVGYRRWHHSAGADRGRRRGAGQEAGRGAGQRARLGCRRHAAGVGHRGRRSRRDRSGLGAGGSRATSPAHS